MKIHWKNGSALARLALTLVLGLALAIALGLALATGTGVVLADDQADGSTIASTQTVSGTWGPGTLTATTDIDIQAGVIITVAPGTTIQISMTDDLNVGVDAARIEIIVQNGAELRVNGPVTFTSQAATPARADWYGIRYLGGSSGWVDEAIVEYGVHALTLDTANPVTVTDSHLRYNQHAPAANNLAYGAGLHIVQGNHLIQNVRIYSNTATASGSGQVRGAGIYIVAGAPHILDSWIYENTATGNNAGAGGGIGMIGGGALIERSYVLTNTMTGGGNNQLKSGGGIGFAGNTSAVIRDSWIVANRNALTDGYAGGGGVGFGTNGTASLIEGSVIYANYVQGPDWCEGCGIDTWDTTNSVVINNNLIMSNTSGTCLAGYGAYGGGINMNGSAAGIRLVNNTIVGNVAGRGGGAYLQGGTVFALNNIVVNNTATIAGQAGGIQRGAGTANYNDIFGNSTPQTGGSMGANNIYVDPLFVSAGDMVQWYHIRPGSPVVDAGTATGAPADDYDGEARPAYGGWDMGFDEVPDVVRPFAALKHASPDPALGYFAVGEEIVYTVNLINNEVADASGRITDVLPLSTTLSSDPTCSTGACGYDSGSNVITWTGSLAYRGLLTLDYTAVVDAPLPDGTTITNTATISMSGQISTTNVVTTVLYSPDLSVSKTRVGGTPTRGVPFDLRITVNNTDPLAYATGVVVTDTLPVNGTYVSGGSLSGNTVRWTIPSIPPDGSAQVSFRVWTCDASLTNAYYRVITSTQVVTSALGPQYTTPLNAPALVADFDRAPFVLESAPTEINVGNTVIFTDTSTTNGQPVTDWRWDFGDGFGATGVANTSHAYDTPGTFTVTLTITDGCGFVDSEIKQGLIVVQAPALTLTKRAEPEPVEPGDVLSHTIVVSNVGSGYASGLTVSDTVPAGTTYVPGSSQVAVPVLQSATYRDELASRAYDGTDGTVDWSSQPWFEVGDDGVATSGDVQVATDQGDFSIRVRQDNNGVTRTADLSGYTAATLAFDYRRQGLDSGESVTVAVSDDGGGSWTALDNFGTGNDAAYQPTSYDITAYISTATTIRFLSAGLDNDDYFYVDNVHVEITDEQVTTSPGGDPPFLASGVTLNAGKRMTVTFAATVDAVWSGGPVITNTAAVSCTQDTTPAIGEATSSVTTTPVVNVVKDGPAVADVGTTAVYTFTITNLGNSWLQPTSVEDDVAGAGTFVRGDTSPDGWLDTTESWVYTASATIQPADPDQMTNTVAVTATDSLGVDVTDTTSHTTDIEHTPVVTIVKLGPAAADVGDTLVYTFSVSHDGSSDSSPVGGLALTDTVAGAAAYVRGDTDVDDELDAGETWVFTATYTVQPADPDPLLNTGTVEGADLDGEDVTADSNTHSTAIAYAPVLTITKEGPATAEVGDTLVFSFTVSHDGSSDGSPVSGVAVSDTVAGAAAYVQGDTDTDDELDAGETWVFTATYTVQSGDPDPLLNTGTVEGVDPDGDDVTADSTIHSTTLQYTLVVNVVGAGTVDVDPDQVIYLYGDVVTLTTNPDPGWSFAGWSGDLGGTLGLNVLFMDGDKVVTATFTQDAYTLVVNIVGDGAVDKDPDQLTYLYGDVVTLTANPDPGWSFAGWSGDLGGTLGLNNVFMDGNKEVTATFTQDNYTLVVDVVGDGTVDVDPDQATYVYGDVVTLTANPDPGWSFIVWNGDLASAANPDTITIDGDKVVTATFAQDAYTLVVNVVGDGTVDRDPDQAAYVHGDVVTLTANPDPGWSFGGWSGDLVSATSPDTIRMDGARVVTATFTQDAYTLVVNVVGDGAVDKDPDQATYVYGDVVTLTANPDPAWSFAGWSGDLVSATSPDTITMDGDKVVTGTFTRVGVPGVTVSPVSVVVEEGGATDVYSVSLDSEPTDVVTITVATDGQTTVDPVSLVFEATNWSIAQPVTVTPVDDADVEGPHTGTISHTATSADTGYDGITIADVFANITDNDLPPALPSVQLSASSYSAKETAGEALIAVTLSATATQPVTVTVGAGGGTAEGGSDYTPVSGALRFDIGQISRTFAVEVLGDAKLEGDETVLLTLTNPINGVLGSPDTATLTIIDNVLRLPVIMRGYSN